MDFRAPEQMMASQGSDRMIRVRRRLGLEIGALLAAKLVLLTALYLLFFTQPASDSPPAVATHILGAR